MFRRFAEDKLEPIAEHIHRDNADIPEEIIAGLAEMGAFGLSIPEEYGGYGDGRRVRLHRHGRRHRGAVARLARRRRLADHPTRDPRPGAAQAGGTEDQKQEWLPKLATAEVMNAVAVTEPDYGSDVAGVKVTATARRSTAAGYVINGVKTWCTFGARADVLMLLARTDPDRSIGPPWPVDVHRAEAARRRATASSSPRRPTRTVPGGGKMEGRPIDTIGYRGMHSYEVALEDWFVPAEQPHRRRGRQGQRLLLPDGRFRERPPADRGAGHRRDAGRVRGRSASTPRTASCSASPIGDYQLTKAKLARMAVLIQGARQFSYEVARLMAKGEGRLEASMIKAYVCKAAEWVTREAMQIHGGMGYAEEYDVSRYFVDARVLSIFEGADETLCLKVIARRLVG